MTPLGDISVQSAFDKMQYEVNEEGIRLKTINFLTEILFWKAFSFWPCVFVFLLLCAEEQKKGTCWKKFLSLFVGEQFSLLLTCV